MKIGEKKMGIRFLLLGLATFALAACSGGASSSGEDARAQQQRDSKVLEDLFTGVQGTWTGTVSNPSSGLADFDGELNVYIYYVQDGSNPDGSAKRLRPKRSPQHDCDFGRDDRWHGIVSGDDDHAEDIVGSRIRFERKHADRHHSRGWILGSLYGEPHFDNRACAFRRSTGRISRPICAYLWSA